MPGYQYPGMYHVDPGGQKYIIDPKDQDILHKSQSNEEAMMDQLLGKTNTPPATQGLYQDPAQMSQAAADKERARWAARKAAQGAQEQHIREQPTEEGFFERLLRPFNPFAAVSDELDQPPPQQR